MNQSRIHYLLVCLACLVEWSSFCCTSKLLSQIVECHWGSYRYSCEMLSHATSFLVWCDVQLHFMRWWWRKYEAHCVILWNCWKMSAQCQICIYYRPININFLHKNLAFSLTFNLVDLVSSLTNYAPHTILVANNCTSACKLVDVAMDELAALLWDLAGSM